MIREGFKEGTGLGLGSWVKVRVRVRVWVRVKVRVRVRFEERINWNSIRYPSPGHNMMYIILFTSLRAA